MMNYRHLLRAIVPCLLLASAPLLSHCGEAAGLGTETGNPPRLEEKRLYLEVVAGGIRVVGTPGAIAPPSASVRVTNLTTGVSVEASAAADGSLDVVIAAEPGDELEVRVSSGGQEVSERLSFGEIARRSDLSGASCQALESTLYQTVNEVFEDADTACTDDVDCMSIGHGAAASCYYECGIDIVSRSGAAVARSRGEQLTASVCAALEACDRPAPSSCPLLDPGFPRCIAGRCQGVEPSTFGCDDILETAQTRRTQLRDTPSKQCVEDTDCGLANIGVRCLFDCEYIVDSVAVSGVAALEASIRDEVDSAYCALASANRCEPATIDCSPPTGTATAVCNTGTCEVEYVGLTGK
jgi:hypothetical protein